MNIEVKKSKIHGKGVFAKRNFEKGEVVLKWNPKKLSLKKGESPTKEQKKNTISKQGKYYLMQPPERYVNHSCEPNTKMNINKFKDIAIKSIKKGEEITSSYPNIDGEKESCRCGSKKCKKFM